MKAAVMLELLFVMVVVCVFFLVMVIVKSTWTDITADDPVFTEHADMKAYTDQAMSLFGFFGVFMFGGSLVAMIIISFMQESHPIFLAISVIVFIISIPVMAMSSNFTMEMVTSDSDWETEADSMPMSTQMIGNLALWGTVAGVLIMIALYAKFER